MCSEGLIERYINFYTDFAFKKFFGTPANKEFLISFLNALLQLEGEEIITNIKHLNSEKLPNIESDRKAIYDVYCENQKHEKFVVEMQKASQINFKDRTLFYCTFPIQEQAEKGYIYELGDKKSSWDYNLKKVYIISVLNFILDKDPQHNNVITHARLKYDEYNCIYSDKLEFINIEMPKFKKDEDELNNMIDKWLYAMKNLYHLIDRPKILQETIFKKLFNLAEISKYNSSELLAYRDSLKDYRDYYNTINSAKLEGEKIGVEKGRKEGIEKGRKEGIEKGRKEGIEKGRKEEREKAYQEKLEIAKKFKSMNISIDQISIATGLSKEDIENL
ncbi:MAG: Rpn family recombination-promoting nuclease/putative transposase [Bacteroidales bacterium]|nr:Rpn family recombination-promoting nuclease/putative transposase [Bacteroidales bacterium]